MLNNKLSILVIARNEEDKLLSCLSKLRDGDELIVLLDRSKDNSSQIAKKFNAKVIEGDWPNEGKRRNFGLSQCAGDWILEIDADEHVSPNLIKEIKKKIKNAKPGYFLIPFDNYIGERKVRYGWGASWGVSAAPRLFSKGSKTWSTDQSIHPSVKLMGKKGWLENRINHYVDKNFSDMIKRLDRYTMMKAEDLRSNGRKNPPLYVTIRRGITRFYKCYFLRKGYKEGKWGFIIAIMASMYIILSYVRAELENNKQEPK